MITSKLDEADRGMIIDTVDFISNGCKGCDAYEQCIRAKRNDTVVKCVFFGALEVTEE